MATLSYDGNVISQATGEISSVLGKIENLSSDIKQATNKIVSAKGFNEYIGGITTDSFSDLVNECGQGVQFMIQFIKQVQIDVLSYSQDEEAIDTFLDSLDRVDYNTLDLTGIEDHISFGRKALNVLKGASASVGTFFSGFVEGVFEFGETACDLLTMGATAAASIFTGGYDLITGSNLTEKMWDETKAHVSEKKVESIFDSFYADTSLGQYLKNNAYGFDTCRSVGSGVGYSTAMIGATIFTAGVTSGAGIGVSAKAALGTITGKAVAQGSLGVAQLATSAGVFAISRGSEDAWADGATVVDGLKYGISSSAWEAAQWAIGAKISQTGGFGDRIASKLFNNSKVAASLTRVGLDTVDSGIEGFVQPILNMTYKDYSSYAEAFEDAGGWDNVKNQALMGAVMSAGGEINDARKVLKSAKDSPIVQNEIDTKNKAETDITTKVKNELSSDVDVNSKPEANNVLKKDAIGNTMAETDIKTDTEVKLENTVQTRTETSGNSRVVTSSNTPQRVETRTDAEVKSVNNVQTRTETSGNSRVVTSNNTPQRVETRTDAEVKPVNNVQTRTETSGNSRVVTSNNTPQRVEARTNAEVKPVNNVQTRVETRTETVGNQVNNVQKISSSHETVSSLNITENNVLKNTTGNQLAGNLTSTNISSDIIPNKVAQQVESIPKLSSQNTASSLTNSSAVIAGGSATMANISSMINTQSTPIDVNIKVNQQTSIKSDIGSSSSPSYLGDGKSDLTIKEQSKTRVTNSKLSQTIDSEFEISQRKKSISETSAKNKTTLETQSNKISFASDDTIDTVAKKLDDAVNSGRMTRTEADTAFLEVDERLHLSEKSRINELMDENARYVSDRDANIRRKQELMNEAGAKPENLNGYDEAVKQINDHIARNEAEIESLKGKLSSESTTYELEINKAVEIKKQEGLQEVANSKLSQTSDAKLEVSQQNSNGAGIQIDKTKNQVRAEMDTVAETLNKRKVEMGDAQTRLDDYRSKNGINVNDNTRTISLEEQRLIKDLDKARSNYNEQYQKLVNKQKQYVEVASKDLGTIGTESHNKIINGPNGEFVTGRPEFTDARAKVEGQVDGSALKKIESIKTDIKISSADTSLDGPKGQANKITLETSSDRTKNQVRAEMDTVAETLNKRKVEMGDAQTRLDDYRSKNGINVNDKIRTISSEEQRLIKDLDKARSNYNEQYQKLVNKQKQYVEVASKDLGTIGTESHNKIINGPNGEFVTGRPEFTDARAKVEGQVEGSALRRLDAEQDLVKSQISGSNQKIISVSQLTDEKIRFSASDTIDTVAKKLDDAVNSGRMTRTEADTAFLEVDERLHLSEKSRINELMDENARYVSDRDANIRRKQELMNEAGAKPENLNGYDEAVKQINDHIARNEAEIESLKGKLSSESTTYELEINKAVEIKKQEGLQEVANSKLSQTLDSELEVSQSQKIGVDVTREEIVADLNKLLSERYGREVSVGEVTVGNRSYNEAKYGREIANKLDIYHELQAKELGTSIDFDYTAKTLEPKTDYIARSQKTDTSTITTSDFNIKNSVTPVVETIKPETEAQSKVELEQRPKQETEAQSKVELEQRPKQETDAQSKVESEQRPKQETDVQSKVESESRVKQETDAQSKVESESIVKQETDVQSKVESEQRPKQETDVQSKVESESRVKQETDANYHSNGDSKIKEEQLKRITSEYKAEINRLDKKWETDLSNIQQEKARQIIGENEAYENEWIRLMNQQSSHEEELSSYYGTDPNLKLTKAEMRKKYESLYEERLHKLKANHLQRIEDIQLASNAAIEKVLSRYDSEKKLVNKSLKEITDGVASGKISIEELTTKKLISEQDRLERNRINYEMEKREIISKYDRQKELLNNAYKGDLSLVDNFHDQAKLIIRRGQLEPTAFIEKYYDYSKICNIGGGGKLVTFFDDESNFVTSLRQRESEFHLQRHNSRLSLMNTKMDQELRDLDLKYNLENHKIQTNKDLIEGDEMSTDFLKSLTFD